MDPAASIQGDCAPRFAAVREAFAANFAAGREVGASFAASVDGRLVVDLWGGHADAARTRPWERDTIVNVWSVTKAMTSLTAHVLVDRKLLDVDAPVAEYWPEFAQAGKGKVTVRHVLSHQAGLAAIRTPLPRDAFYDWECMTGALAAETPWWEPGSTSGYHALTFGFLVGEIVRRITGRTLGAFLHDEITAPLGADFHIGLAESEDARVAEMIPPTAAEAKAAGPQAQIDPESMLGKLMRNPLVTPPMANQPAWRRAEVPAANGHGNARSIVRVLSALACGGTLDGERIIGAEALAAAIEPQWTGRDLVLNIPMRWALGFMRSSDVLPLGPNPRCFGHGGWGGSLGIADADGRVAWAYVMNKMSPGTTGDSRAAQMLAALYSAS
jgi:CubicO group peptidase (beta-lactamase class C family)